jgi:very-short-patch-repair endonuclease
MVQGHTDIPAAAGRLGEGQISVAVRDRRLWKGMWVGGATIYEVSAAPKPADLRHAIASAISELKAYDVADFCTFRLGLAPPRDSNDDPFMGKYRWVHARLQGLNMTELLSIARTVLGDRDDEALQKALDRVELGLGGVAGELRNLIFASTGPKPEIVLRDAVNNAIEITKGADTCLVFDDPIAETGLSWATLIEWWSRHSDFVTDTEIDPARSLWRRLIRSTGSEPERLLFSTFGARYATSADIPALIPQVYLHYDPYLRPDPAKRPGSVVRQRMDFLLLLPNRRRVVIEIDGRHHYADAAGRADTAAYATMVAEDRRLRLTGYEVYRFGGHELQHDAVARRTLNDFFDEILSNQNRKNL